MLEFSDVFDRALAQNGPAAIFTFSHEGELRVDVLRTRNFWQRCEAEPSEIEWCHCVLIDKATGWPQYALLTSPALCIEHETTVVRRTDSFDDAMIQVESEKQKVFQSHRSGS